MIRVFCAAALVGFATPAMAGGNVDVFGAFTVTDFGALPLGVSLDLFGYAEFSEMRQYGSASAMFGRVDVTAGLVGDYFPLYGHVSALSEIYDEIVLSSSHVPDGTPGVARVVMESFGAVRGSARDTLTMGRSRTFATGSSQGALSGPATPYRGANLVSYDIPFNSGEIVYLSFSASCFSSGDAMKYTDVALACDEHHIWRGVRSVSFAGYGPTAVYSISGSDPFDYRGGVRGSGGVSLVPEPSVWLGLITGFGLIGAARRRRDFSAAR